MCYHAGQRRIFLDLREKAPDVSGYIIQHQPSARRHDLAQDQAEKKWSQISV